MMLEHKSLEFTVSIGDHETVLTYQFISVYNFCQEVAMLVVFSAQVSLYLLSCGCYNMNSCDTCSWTILICSCDAKL